MHESYTLSVTITLPLAHPPLYLNGGATYRVVSPTMDRKEYPWLYRAADRASAEAQERHFLSLGFQLIIFSLVGLLSAIPTWMTLAPKSSRWVALLSAVVLAVGVVVVLSARERKFEKQWFDARAIAESAKTITWRYMMRVPPFQIENQTAETALIEELQEVSSSRPGALGQIGGIEEDTTQFKPLMRKVRNSSFDERKAYYLASRLADQRDWYHVKAAFNRSHSQRWYWTVLGIQVLAIILAILKAADFLKISPVGFLMTIGASFSAWTQAKRHEDLRTTYSVAEDELNNLEAKLDLCTTETELLGYVEDVEEAVSREHTMWRARRNVAS